MNMLAAVIIGLAVFEASPVAAESPKKLYGAQIRARLAGMQLTDEVHYRFVYDRDGRLRSYSMGVKKSKWVIEKHQLCLISGRRMRAAIRLQSAANGSR